MIVQPSNIPPPNGIHASIVHRISEFYKIIYLHGKKLSKSDKLGIHAKIQDICLLCLNLSIEAALSTGNQKLLLAEKLKTEIEVIKQLVRLEMEIGVIQDNCYIPWQEKLQEISRMTAGWIKYLQKKEPA